jgi:hypothetical protein
MTEVLVPSTDTAQAPDDSAATGLRELDTSGACIDEQPPHAAPEPDAETARPHFADGQPISLHDALWALKQREKHMGALRVREEEIANEIHEHEQAIESLQQYGEHERERVMGSVGYYDVILRRFYAQEIGTNKRRKSVMLPDGYMLSMRTPPQEYTHNDPEILDALLRLPSSLVPAESVVTPEPKMKLSWSTIKGKLDHDGDDVILPLGVVFTPSGGFVNTVTGEELPWHLDLNGDICDESGFPISEALHINPINNVVVLTVTGAAALPRVPVFDIKRRERMTEWKGQDDNVE